MKNNFSKILITILAMVTLLCAFAMVANAAAVAEGTTNTGFAWAVTECESGYLLTISDTEASKGAENFSWAINNKTPGYGWYLDCNGYRTKITEIVFESSVPSIGYYALGGFTALKKITIPKTLTTIRDNAFFDSKYLVTLAVAGEELGDYTINFKYLTDVAWTGNRFLEACFDSKANYKVYLSNSTVLKSAYSAFANLNAGDIFYVEEDYPYLTQLNTLATRYGFTVAYYPKAESAMEMYGYQVRTEDYNGLRGIFNYNENAVNEGFTLIEYGAILATDANRGENDANIKLSYNEETGEYEPTVEKIVKKAIKKNGALVPGAKTLKKLNGQAVGDIEGYGEGYTWFATTIVNFTHSYTSDIYMCGYEILKNKVTGETSIIYTSYEYPEYETASIYDVSIELIADGFTNDLENNPVGSVVKAAGAVTLTSTDATLPTGAESLVAENIEMKGYSGGAFTAGTTYYSLYEMADGNYLAYISGEGLLTASALQTAYASGYAGNARPVPTLLEAAYNKITHMVVGEGIDCIATFANMNKLVSIIYPKSLTRLGYWKTFQNCNALEKIVPVGSMTDEKIFEFDGIGVYNDGLYNIQWTFQNCSAVEYIHLNGYQGGTDSFYQCKALKAIWIGDAERPADGIADLRNATASSVDMSSFTTTPNLTTLLLSDAVNTLVETEKWGFSISTIYQPTANDTIKSFCEGNNKTSKVVTYTQTLPN